MLSRQKAHDSASINCSASVQDKEDHRKPTFVQASLALLLAQGPALMGA